MDGLEEKREGVVIEMDAVEAHSEEKGERGMGGGGGWMSLEMSGSNESIPCERIDSWMPEIERR
ncbi:hypothetical protein FXO38_29959, partial [Capsicum annuum]